jgi:hypothetical protein
MHDRASELRRILFPRTLVNKGQEEATVLDVKGKDSEEPSKECGV